MKQTTLYIPTNEVCFWLRALLSDPSEIRRMESLALKTMKLRLIHGERKQPTQIKNRGRAIWPALAEEKSNRGTPGSGCACVPPYEFTQILAVATTAADVSVITTRIARCGLPVSYAIEAMNVLSVLKYRPDLMVVHVRQGRELRAYYAGLAAVFHETPVIFVVPDVRTSAVDALLRAMPLCAHVECSGADAELATQIMMALD